ncbi:hypothetical protein CYL16_03310 [Mycobacterium sp. EPG1]|nr:hypothetical protein CYL16_03310 [Mycobacterium sp. EPG1]
MTKTFDQWWDESGQHWAAAVVENGGTLWTDSMDERRELFDRRYIRPAPPAGMFRDPRPTRTENYEVTYPERTVA